MDCCIKEVSFDIYCLRCIHKDLAEEDHPCDECLTIPARENTHVPEYWEGEHK